MIKKRISGEAYDPANHDFYTSMVTFHKICRSAEELGLNAGDAWLLYTGYTEQYFIQESQTTFSNNIFMQKKFGRGKEKMLNAKKTLINAGVIEDIIKRGEGGKIAGHYIKVKYVKRIVSNDVEIDDLSSGRVNQTVAEPDGGKTETNTDILKINTDIHKENADILNINNINTTSSVADALPNEESYSKKTNIYTSLYTGGDEKNNDWLEQAEKAGEVIGEPVIEEISEDIFESMVSEKHKREYGNSDINSICNKLKETLHEFGLSYNQDRKYAKHIGSKKFMNENIKITGLGNLFEYIDAIVEGSLQLGQYAPPLGGEKEFYYNAPRVYNKLRSAGKWNFGVEKQSEWFDEFIAKYPRREGREDAKQWYVQNVRKEELHKEIMEGVEGFVKHVGKLGIAMNYIKIASRFLVDNSRKDFLKESMPEDEEAFRLAYEVGDIEILRQHLIAKHGDKRSHDLKLAEYWQVSKTKILTKDIE